VGVVAISQRPFRRLLGEQAVAIVVLGIVRGAAGVRHAAYDSGLPRAESFAGRGVPSTPDAVRRRAPARQMGLARKKTRNIHLPLLGRERSRHDQANNLSREETYKEPKGSSFWPAEQRKDNRSISYQVAPVMSMSKKSPMAKHPEGQIHSDHQEVPSIRIIFEMCGQTRK
jgi:hypothetical protein